MRASGGGGAVKARGLVALVKAAQARRMASLWVQGLEEQSLKEERARMRKARFRRQYVDELLRTTTVQGFLNFTFRDRHISEHLVWAVALVLGCVCSALLCLSTWDHYQISPVVQSLERNYINWKYELPSVVMCPMSLWNNTTVAAVAERLAAEKGAASVENLQSFLEALTTSTSYSRVGAIGGFENNEQGLPLENWLNLAVEVRWSFQFQSLSRHSSISTEIVTEVGICQAINSQVLYTTAVNVSERRKAPHPPFVVSSFSEVETMSTASGNSAFLVYVQGVNELPNPAFSTSRVTMDKKGFVILEVGQVYATPALQELSVEQRRCRYEDDVTPGSPRPRYSRDNCMEVCRARLAQRLCGCKPFFVNVTGIRTCDFKGMACLNKYSELLLWMQNRTTRERMDCGCLPACNTFMYRTLSKETVTYQKEYGPPALETRSVIFLKTRIKRDVLFSIIDLAVSFGGAVGLFLGVSVLSVLEIVYYFTLRLFFHPERRDFI